MHKPKRISHTVFSQSIMLIFIFTVLSMANWGYTEYRKFRIESDEIKHNLITSKKRLLKRRVNEVIDYIGYNQSRVMELTKHRIQSRVYEAHTLATHIYNRFYATTHPEQIALMIKEALRPIRFSNGKGYYFITSLDGIEQLFPDHPEMEGKDLLDMTDIRGQHVIRDMINLVTEKGEGFYQYHWTKPGITGKSHAKIAFVKYFAPLNWLIGTGAYLDDMEDEMKKYVTDWVKHIRFGTDGYIFIFRFDGVYICHVDDRYIGQNMLWITDTSGVHINKELLRLARRPGGGFLRYQWEKSSTGALSTKMSYVKAYPDWQWVIGTGIYLDEIDHWIAKSRSQLIHHIYQHIVITLWILIIIVVAIILIARMFSHHIAKELDVFIVFFRKGAMTHEQIDKSRLRFVEFHTLADIGNWIVAQWEKAQAHLKQVNQQLEDRVRERTTELVTLNDSMRMEIVQRRQAQHLLSQKASELERSNKALAKSNDELSQFAHVISHDLQEPLRMISSFAKLLNEEYHGKLDANGQDYIQFINDGTQRMQLMIESLLAWARIGKNTNSFQLVSSKAILKDVIHDLQSLILETHTQIIHGHLPEISAIPSQLYQLFLNLITNAMKFNTHPSPKIYISAQKTDEHWCFSIRDNGIGIDPVHFNRIFEMFQRLHTRQEYPGTGIGLAICKKIVDYHQGQIWVESTPGNGSTFYFTLPLLAGELDDDNSIAEQPTL